MTVGQALSLASNSPWHPMAQQQQQAQGGGLSAEFQAQQQAASMQLAAQQRQAAQAAGDTLHAGPGPGGRATRAHVCSKDDTLRRGGGCLGAGSQGS